MTGTSHMCASNDFGADSQKQGESGCGQLGWLGRVCHHTSSFRIACRLLLTLLIKVVKHNRCMGKTCSKYNDTLYSIVSQHSHVGHKTSCLYYWRPDLSNCPISKRNSGSFVRKSTPNLANMFKLGFAMSCHGLILLLGGRHNNRGVFWYSHLWDMSCLLNPLYPMYHQACSKALPPCFKSAS